MEKQATSPPTVVFRRHTFHVSSFAELPQEYKDLVVNTKTGIEEMEAETNLDVVLSILRYKTGHHFWSPLLADRPKETKKFHTGPSLIDQEITATRDLVSESDALVTTEIAKKHYTFLKSIGPRRLDMVRSTCDNVYLAVKRVSHPQDDVRKQRENFRQVRFLKYVKGHPNLVSFVRCTMYKNELWIAMECLMGGTLQEAKSHFQFHEKHVKYIASHVLNGLDFLHQQFLGHRNLRSDHVMFSLNGNVKIIDFSLMTDFSQGPLVHMVGSPWWMSPEMIKGEPHTLSTDLWSFGILLLEMINGQPPYRKSSVKAMFVAGTIGYPLIPLSKRQRWSTELSSFLEACLQVDPEKRWTAAKLRTHKWLKNPPKKRAMVELFNGFRQSGTTLTSMAVSTTESEAGDPPKTTSIKEAKPVPETK
eukprot:TRINITY_DN8614_c0_g1_i3.p1 TRINITY_DN8614_c0_g1~~TRINITY_DN8614_c0_g1_i3.p1  ORF type:complete len:419 (+),score=61.73 TRINITY_DN8614_c0_g1_i3:82-1338(+)